jgi:hypothetical protein
MRFYIAWLTHQTNNCQGSTLRGSAPSANAGRWAPHGCVTACSQNRCNPSSPLSPRSETSNCSRPARNMECKSLHKGSVGTSTSKGESSPGGCSTMVTLYNARRCPCKLSNLMRHPGIQLKSWAGAQIHCRPRPELGFALYCINGSLLNQMTDLWWTPS